MFWFGHTGLSSATMFDNLDKLEKGDNFYIKSLDRLLEYRITSINVVLPDETECLTIQEGQDLVTLVTCTPKHINTHRLLVTGSRVLVDDAEQKSNVNIAIICIVIILALFIIFLIFKTIRFYRKKH